VNPTLAELIDREQRAYGLGTRIALHNHMLKCLPEADERTIDDAVAEYWKECCCEA
jgi:hypothetical protein